MQEDQNAVILEFLDVHRYGIDIAEERLKVRTAAASARAFLRLNEVA
jgi:hypothetical protein